MTTTLEAAPAVAGRGIGGRETARKVAIVCSKGSLDMAYPGLILANAARMMGIEAVLFFTFWGMDIIHRKKSDSLHAGMLGNPSSPVPHAIMGLPGMEGLATRMMKKKMDQMDIPPVSEMLEILNDAGAEIYACQMAMEMYGLQREDLVPQVREVITAMDFFEKSEGAQIIFI